MYESASVLSLATAVPPLVLNQTDVAKACHQVFSGRVDGWERLATVFATTGIRKRHTVRPIEWFLEDRGWPDRTSAYLEGAGDLFVAAASEAISAAGLTASEIDAVVTVSSTGIATPSLDARCSARMGFREDINRVPVFGLGCAAGVTGLGIASRLAAAAPGSRVLLVAVELCTLLFRLDRLDKANIISTALFGDGAAACVVSTGPGGIAEIETAGEHTWPDTLDVMGWDAEDRGLGVVLARAVPPFAETRIGPAVDAMLGRAGLGRTDVDRFVCHPGGTKVVAALELGLGLDQGSLDHEREVLADYGNMSAPTALFVLARCVAAGLPHRAVLLAMGPGFSASCVSLVTRH